MPDSHDHHAADADSVAVGVVTISSSRTLADDDSGDAIEAALAAGPHRVVDRELVSDDERAIREQVRAWRDRADIEAILTTGGTGVTPDDVTPEALEALVDRRLPGFGERFRARSIEQAGPHGMLTRATAGIVGETAVICLPGSVDAARLGVEIASPVLGHLVGLTGREDDRESPAESPAGDRASLTHLDAAGDAQMVDVGRKADSHRRAVARGAIRLRPATIDAIRADDLEKGDVLGTARTGAIQAVKHTWETIPMCHQLPITNVETTVELADETVELTVAVETTGKTGCEMEALEGVTAGLNVVWDMVKAAEKDADGEYPATAIEDVRVLTKRVERE